MNSLRILVIDDSDADIELLLHAVRRDGYSHLTHESVNSASSLRASLQQCEWDVITCDNAMPGFDARTAIAVAREIQPHVPLIIVSSEIGIPLVVTLLKSGAYDYVPKRELARLASVIDRALHDEKVNQEHHEALQALRVSESRYRRLFETAQDGILIIDAESEEITDVNPFLFEMLGYTKNDFLGKKLWDLVAFKDVEASKRSFGELQSIGYIRYEDLPLQTKHGRRIDVEFVSNRYLVDSKQIIQCNIRNISERVLAENKVRKLTARLEERVGARTIQLEALNKELEAFSYTVSHDLRAPLRQVDGYTQMLQETHSVQGDANAMSVAVKIRGSVARMNGLIDALLKLAHLSLNALKREPVDVSALVHIVAAELQQRDPSRHVEWKIAEGATADADPQLLRVVLDNLLGNAWKFSAQRDCAHIEFGVSPQADGSITFFESDDGAGFDMSHADKLFGAFQRFHSGNEFPGSGIGLATVQRIVHRHGGRVWAESSVDHGATFYFTLADSPIHKESGIEIHEAHELLADSHVH
ncbi:MAG TPA: ATP-binding protein [Steroidobacteraceae bacterium]|nr:ATP-binding protein [Steroidobacteraceae bacterium]